MLLPLARGAAVVVGTVLLPALVGVMVMSGMVDVDMLVVDMGSLVIVVVGAAAVSDGMDDSSGNETPTEEHIFWAYAIAAVR